ncbi:protein of unknown function [Taphrina deformans PYCC 5710]|uniref:Uncharacterized protein n=1 Tax=Taphrina deformans (strain PYCC 5710 / ATCC 11124 / CBS 356.35 / IMI 108563 / JCM 9778 / NBRC 8474) TaxID=1097556 RepID=R4XFR0_TAPDE|nr:protein of unknown function [Taphrina deformans PYCC 5710]|eukprot:CCG84588.1 protein of unknown function [Taphrina deformans PYCC 5710]
MSGFDQVATDAAGVLLNTIVEDTHLEDNPQVAPATVADDRPVIVDTNSDLDYPEVLPEPRADKKRPTTASGQPLPDLRHEQTYLAALARTDGSYVAAFRVTLIDFLIWPTITQFAYVLGLNAFKYLRTGSTRTGRQFGHIIRDFLNVGGVLD